MLDAAYTSGTFETSRHREVLGFTHHAEVAALPADEADALLDWCEEPKKRAASRARSCWRRPLSLCKF